MNEAAINCAKAVEAARLDEREQCAKIAETWRSPYGGPRDFEVAEAISAIIRKRSEPDPVYYTLLGMPFKPKYPGWLTINSGGGPYTPDDLRAFADLMEQYRCKQ